MESLFFFPIYNLSHQSALLDFLMKFGAVYLIYLAFAAIALTTLKSQNDKKALVISLLSLGICLIIIELIRLVYYEPRPYMSFNIDPLIYYTTEASFPSKHTAIMATLAFSYLYFKSKLAPFLILGLVWVGFSRVYVGVHYPVDILGGVLVGFISVKLSLRMKSQLRRYLT